jgi:quercetin dioxygenase-like cupin family protein
MAAVGQTIENPASGERITFRRLAAETGSELLAIDLELPAGRRVPGGLHVHPLQEERFEVVSGRLRLRLGRTGRKRIVAGPGETIVVPAGMPHDFANAGDEDALVRVEVRPALQMERLFETAVALAEQGRTMRNGIPKPLDLALFVREFEQEVQGAFPPLWLQRIVLAPLAWMAERRGLGAVYGRQGDRDGQPVGTPALDSAFLATARSSSPSRACPESGSADRTSARRTRRRAWS